MKIRRSNKGLTLVELIISLAILGIIITPIYALTINTIKVNKRSEDKQKALVIAEEYIEYAKSSLHSIEDVKNLPLKKDGFVIKKIIEGIEKYREEDDGIPEDIIPDLDVIINKYNFIIFSDKIGGSFNGNGKDKIEGNILTIICDDKGSKDARITFSIGGNFGYYDLKKVYGEDIVLKITLNGSLPLKLSLLDEYSGKFIVYIAPSDFNYVKDENVIVKNGSQSGQERYRLYKVSIKVWKEGHEDTEEPLQTIEGYKVIAN
ncbi:prepilin-type N-terminal cleavage/methylation domain-containing protein [Clostridium bovifaecis]|uniref:Prepilin-type N-terminal cleavage/methylation domain-containing protein n=1 Tax=Clostridium bovifaecis TaxID=2184719 RepID=A0A6I6EQ34_9CLOT|nr:prepilin-type N-terminal cleavage/methylation domain-containing protein [Clostridium bovifaecis]